MSRLFTEINNAKQQQAKQLKDFDAQSKSSTDSPALPTNTPSKKLTDSPTPTNKSNHPTQPNDRTVHPNESTERVSHSPTPHPQDTNNVSINPGSKEKSVMVELATGPAPEAKRLTERYSFEIYTDQVHKINKLKYLYYERFSKNLTKSRIIRDALDDMLDKAFEALDTISESK